MSPRWPKRVEVDGSHEPLDVAGVMVSAGDLLDPRPMLQKHVHHVQRVALAVITVDRGTILQRLAGDAIDDAGFAVCHLEHYAIKYRMAGVVIAVQRALRTSVPASSTDASIDNVRPR